MDIEGKEKSSIKSQLIKHLIAIACFLVITMVYFSPVFQGKVLSQGDINHYQGAVQELTQYYENEGESSAWTGSMFSGMPAYQIGIHGGSPNFLDYLEKPLKILDPGTAGPIFAAMLMAYILFCMMGFSAPISIIGAIAYSLSSYNIIIIEAGHITKMWALVYMPLVLAGVVGLFKRKYLLGGLLFALGLALQIKANHIQITFYTGLLCVFLYLGYMIMDLISKQYKDLLKIIGVTAIALVLAVACNLGSLYSNYEMSKDSTRGGSELTVVNSGEKVSTGLDKKYAFDWSYGKAETLTLLIPDAKGGSSAGKLEPGSNLSKELAAHGFSGQIRMSPSYWGDQPFTSGPVYLGAIICFLFLLGMIIIDNKMKWVILVATIFFIFLSWGYNFDGFNSWFFYNFPFYNKFRTVSMALVIPAITILMIAVWGVSEFVSGKKDSKKLEKALYWSFGITGGICLFFWLLPDFFFNFTSEQDASLQKQLGQHWDWFSTALLADRKDMFSSDALRSFVFILLAAAVLWVSLKMKDTKAVTLWIPVALAVLVLIDLWSVDRRYLDTAKFQPKLTYVNQTFRQSPADQLILQDKAPSYRVLNMSGGNPFAESSTSYYHKSVGGYSAAKLRRYQDLIDSCLVKELGLISRLTEHYLQPQVELFQSDPQAMGGDPMNISIQDSVMHYFAYTPMLDMLNARYVIVNPSLRPVVNPYALGNAWFVPSYDIVENADAEMAALKELKPWEKAIISKDFTREIAGLNIVPDSTANIELTVYKPNRLVYKSKANSEQLAVFSEVYFANGWEAYIDGKPAPYLRADWVLRAMRVPAGEHEIEFKFIPTEYNACRSIATASSGILVLLLILMLGFEIWNRKKQAN